MSATTFVVVIAVIALAIVVGIWLAFRRRHTDHLRSRFGDEYDRTLDQAGGRARAEAALTEREKRVAALDIRPLTPAERAQFAREWTEVKAVFVDSPAEAVLHADRMLAMMMTAKGFPTADFDRRYEDLSVDHGDVARHYRAAHTIAVRQGTGGAGTEDLRQAMKHYEALYTHLLADGQAPGADAASGRAFDFDGDGRSDRPARQGEADLVQSEPETRARTDKVDVTYN